MVLWLTLIACSGPPSADASPAVAARAKVEDCPTARRPVTALSPAPAIPEVAVGMLARLGAPLDAGLDLTLVIDRSGSMAEEGRMSFVKHATGRIVDALRPGDRLNLVVFDNDACTALSDWVGARDEAGLAHDVIATVAPRGSTDLALGLHAGYLAATQPGWLRDAGRERRLVLITDALVGEDDLDERTTNEVHRAWESYRIALHTVGVGQQANAPLLSHLAELGGGSYAYLGASAWVTSQREAAPVPDPR